MHRSLYSISLLYLLICIWVVPNSIHWFMMISLLTYQSHQLLRYIIYIMHTLHILVDRSKYIHDSPCIDDVPHPIDPIDGRAEAPGRENMSCWDRNGDPNGSKILKILKSGQESLYCTMGGMNYQISRNSSYFELVLIGFWSMVIAQKDPGDQNLSCTTPLNLQVMKIMSKMLNSLILVGGLEHFLFFHNIWDNPPIWIFFRGVGQPPTSHSCRWNPTNGPPFGSWHRASAGHHWWHRATTDGVSPELSRRYRVAPSVILG